ncbi:MAG: tyramine oxidase subunit B [Tissierellia bacterium]|nr:tyramine oxidase subunit B [Tissierellia bacterium]
MKDVSRVDFLYLNEKEMIEAGVMDMAECIDEMVEVYKLLSKGDYVMGGKLQNSHGMVVSFPDEPEHEGMPKNGPDRRFCTMPAYLGGKYRLCGNKWYGSNIENIPKHLPRSILMLTLNDADTGAPIAHMSANLLSAWRTGAIPGVGVRYLAREDSEVVALLGAGAIGTSTAEAILIEAKNAKTVKIFDIVKENAEALKKRINDEYPDIEVLVVDSIEEAVRDADIINLATAGEANPRLEKEWLKKGALITASSSGSFDPDYAINNLRFIVDNWKMYEEATYEDDYPYNNLAMGVIGRLFLDWIHEGKMTDEKIINIGDIINGEIPARESEDDIIIFGLGGQPVYDVAWGYRVYQNALKKNLGTKLNLWERAYQAR